MLFMAFAGGFDVPGGVAIHAAVKAGIVRADVHALRAQAIGPLAFILGKGQGQLEYSGQAGAVDAASGRDQIGKSVV
jgi:hypothetical protein